MSDLSSLGTCGQEPTELGQNFRSTNKKQINKEKSLNSTVILMIALKGWPEDMREKRWRHAVRNSAELPAFSSSLSARLLLVSVRPTDSSVFLSLKWQSPIAFNTVKRYDHPLSSKSRVISQKAWGSDGSENPLQVFAEANLGVLIMPPPPQTTVQTDIKIIRRSIFSKAQVE